MSNLKSAVLILTLITALLLTNTLLLTSILGAFPSVLIHDQSLRSTHSLLLRYLLVGDRGSLAQALPADQLSHIDDVRNVFKWLPLLLVISVTLSILILKEYSKDNVIRLIRRAELSLVLLLIPALLFFTYFFEYFHYMLFPQGNWAFPADSVLIRLYPEQFWMIALGVIVSASLFELQGAKYWLKLTKSL